MAADVVVFQRPMQKEMLEAAKLLKEKGKVIVFDNDDTYIRDSGQPSVLTEIFQKQLDEKIDEIEARLKEFASIADLVTVSTEFLKKEYENVNPNTVVLPNCIDPLDWPKPKRRKSGKVRVGIVGSAAQDGDFNSVLPALRELKDDIQLLVFSTPIKNKANQEIAKLYAEETALWDSFDVEWQHFVDIADYMDALNNMEMDIMVIPRKDTYFNRCKSNVKFLEASMLEIPVIAQGFPDKQSPYQQPEDAKHMLIANTEADWLTHLKTLINDKKLRQKMGKEARKYVLRNYNINNKAQDWAENYKRIYEART